jgi:hypothetical protein
MNELLKIDVGNHIEKKNGLSYLSWAWAWAEVLKVDPGATWEAVEYGDRPAMFLPDGTALVRVVVTIKGQARTCMLPVMDNRNKAIKNPDAFAINTALMRCLAKCIAMHGLGLYIYAGEDLPEQVEAVFDLSATLKRISEAPDLDAAKAIGREVWPMADEHARQCIKEAVETKELPL